MKLLAADIGGSHALCAIVEEQRILGEQNTRISGDLSLYTALESIAESFDILIRQCGLKSGDLQGIVFAFCGLVDPIGRRILSTNGKYSDGATIDLAAWANDRFGLPLRIENDARMALLGERYAGAARGCNDLVTMTLGTGVGGAAMIDSKLLRGRHFQAGCLGGHLLARYGGRTCTCKNIGCVEAEASSWSLPAICREHPEFPSSALTREAVLDFESVCHSASAGDRCAQDVLNHCAEVWSAGMVSLIHAYDPEIVVVGGGAMRSAEMLLPRFIEYVHRHAWTPWGKVEVRAAALGDRAALLGAAPLWRDETL